MKRICCTAVGLVLLCRPVWTQPLPSEREQQRFLYYEAINLPSVDSTKSRIDVHYRIDADFFVPVKSIDSGFPWDFVRHGEILVELVDTEGVSAAREIKRAELGSETSETTLDSKQWHHGIASFNVPPGGYTVIFEVDDLESDRKYLERTRKIHAKPFSVSSFEAWGPIFLEWKDEQLPPRLIRPQNFGGNLRFGQPAAIWFALLSAQASDIPIRIEYSIALASSSDRASQVQFSDTIEQVLHFDGFVLDPATSEDGIRYRLVSSEFGRWKDVLIRVPAEKLPLRPFDLAMTVVQGTSRNEIKKQFRTVWPEMPASLRDIDYAIDALRHIAREGELDSLKRGSHETRRDNLETFWSHRNPNRESAYNEVMTQYYRRVDFAVKNFGTLKESDGSKTDRGKIYILHGPPTGIERSLDPQAGYRETWSYANLNKQFIFVDQSKSGNYTLLITKNL